MLGKIKNLIKRASVSRVGDDLGAYAKTQVVYLGKTNDIELLFPYGFCSAPPTKSLVLMFNVQGNESNKAGTANLPGSRFKGLKAGEVAVGNYLTTSVIKFLENGDVEITSAGNISLDAVGSISLKHEGTSRLVSTSSGVALTGTLTSNGKNISDSHTHPILGGSSAPGPTGGVT